MARFTERICETEHEIQIAERLQVHELQECNLENRKESIGKGLIQRECCIVHDWSLTLF